METKEKHTFQTIIIIVDIPGKPLRGYAFCLRLHEMLMKLMIAEGVGNLKCNEFHNFVVVKSLTSQIKNLEDRQIIIEELEQNSRERESGSVWWVDSHKGSPILRFLRAQLDVAKRLQLYERPSDC